MDSISASEKKGPIAWMAGHSVAANLVMLLCIVGGFFSLKNITQEVFPDITLDQVQVSVSYPGASPEEVEQGIVLAVEEAVRGLDGVDEISSSSAEGSATVTIDLLEGADLQKLGQDIKSEVDRITTFPEEAEEPQVTILSHRRRVITMILYGDTDEAVLREVAEQARDQLLQDENITQVDLSGIRPLEISIEISQDNLRRYGLTLDQVATRLRNASVELPGGGIKTQGGEILVRLKDRRDYGRQFARIPVITTSDGTRVLLEDIAVIRDRFEDVDRYATYNDLPAVMVDVYRVGKQTPTDVSGAVRKQVEILNQSLPPGIQADILWDRAETYKQRVDLLLSNGAMGLVLVFCLLGLFLEIRLAFWVMMGIPISFMGSLLLLPVLDVSINMITLFAYIIALGIVVDDAIVVGENIYFHHQSGLSFQDAAIKGAREVAIPVVFSILTNVVAFLPLYFVPGIMGKVFKMIPIIVISTFIISLLESLFVLPAHLGHQKNGRQRRFSVWLHEKQQRFSHAFIRWVQNVYGPFIEWITLQRYVTVAIGLSLLLMALAYAGSGRLGFSMFPKVESDFARAEAVLPYGTAVEKTDAVVQKLFRTARQVEAEIGSPELVKGIFAWVGNGGSHKAEMRVYLAPPEIREKIMGTDEFTRRWREATGNISGVDVLRFESDFGGPGRGAALTVELSHRNIRVLDQAGTELAAELATYPLASDIDDGFQEGKQQIDFNITPEGQSLGLTAREVARQVRNAFYGSEVLRQQRGRNEIKVMVRLPKTERVFEHNLEELVLRTPAGTDVPLRQVARATRGRAYTTISRREGRRIIQISADVNPRSQAGEIINAIQAEFMPDLTRRYPGLIWSFEGKQADQRDSMNSMRNGFILAMLAIFALLAIPFRSYVQPLIVMFSIPFGIVGAVIGHMLMGYSMSVVSVFGIVALAGVIVNDSLVMVDFANRQRITEGQSAHDAVMSAAIQRFRPIILTTLTTFGGLAPMIMETSRQARFLIPMAISLGFGILFATFITLILVPCLYLIMDDAQKLLPASQHRPPDAKNRLQEKNSEFTHLNS